jgi:hypothetical protein
MHVSDNREIRHTFTELSCGRAVGLLSPYVIDASKFDCAHCRPTLRNIPVRGCVWLLSVSGVGAQNF